MYLQLAIRNLRRVKVRSALAMLGIIIGVTAVSSIGIFGENLKRVVLENFQDMVNEVIILPSTTNGYDSIDEKTLSKIGKSIYISELIPVKSKTAKIEGEKSTYAIVYGLNERDVEELFKAEKGKISLKRKCVVGNTLAKRLDIRVGDRLRIGNKEYKVSAILEREGARFDINPNNAVIVSLQEFSDNFNLEYSMLIVKVKNVDEIENFKKFVERSVNYKVKKVEVFELKSIIERINRAFNQVNLFLMAIAAVSLLVAGVSILNIMLMSTIERTKEIGVMRAIGAFRESILKIFLLESLILGISGSVIGGILSLGGGYLITSLIIHRSGDILNLSSLLYMAEGMFFGTLTSLISGLYPAYRASKLEPIEALRYE